MVRIVFQSTSSVWRTTHVFGAVVDVLAISIHVLRVEDDRANQQAAFMQQLFQSTSSVWRTTADRTATLACVLISIHVLRVEDDSAEFAGKFLHKDFNPRPPCGGRPREKGKKKMDELFQSTSSVWRTTCLKGSSNPDDFLISIHVLRVEDDKSIFAQEW